MDDAEKREAKRSESKRGERRAVSDFPAFPTISHARFSIEAMGNSLGARNFPCDAANESESEGSADWLTAFHLGDFYLAKERASLGLVFFFFFLWPNCGPTCCLATRLKSEALKTGNW